MLVFKKINLRKYYFLSDYDSHLICLNAFGQLSHWDLSVIALTSEKYLTISAKFKVGTYINKDTGEECKKYMEICFKDSYQFLSSSLEKLANNLSVDQLLICKTLPWPIEFSKTKGIFPYSYFDSFDVLNDKILPPKSAFFNDLNNQEISDDDYQRAKLAWEAMGCKSFNDYMLNYLALDVHLLADVFENFRYLSLKDDQIDPVHYPSLPSMSWDLAFKSTGVEIDLLHDDSMYEFFEQGMQKKIFS